VDEVWSPDWPAASVVRPDASCGTSRTGDELREDCEEAGYDSDVRQACLESQEQRYGPGSGLTLAFDWLSETGRYRSIPRWACRYRCARRLARRRCFRGRYPPRTKSAAGSA
jgi:hypothetical protein